MQLRRAICTDAHAPARALRHEKIPVHIHRPLTKPPVHAEDAAAALCHGNGHKKTQRGAAFPAIQHGTDSFFPFRSLNG